MVFRPARIWDGTQWVDVGDPRVGALATDVAAHETRLDDIEGGGGGPPAAHAPTHAAGGSDPLTPAAIGAQPLDADLSTFAALAPSDGVVLRRLAGAWSTSTIAEVKTALALAKADVGLGNVDNTSDVNKPVSAAAQTALDGKQNVDAQLTALGSVSGGADQLPYFTSTTAAAQTPLTGFARTVLDDADAAAARTTLGAVGSAEARVTADQAAGTASIRTLGTGALQAAAGNDTRLSDARTPTAHAHSGADITTGTVAAARLPLVPNPPLAITYAASLTPVASDGNYRVCTATGALTLNPPTSPADGQMWRIRVIASGAERTLTFAAGLRRPSHIASTLVIPSGARGDVGMLYETALGAWTVLAAQAA